MAEIGNALLERQLLARAQSAGLTGAELSEDDLAEQATQAVAAYRRERAASG